MAKLNILKVGDETLRRVSRPVDEISPRIQRLIDDMIETMREANGCGLAAPQVGVLRRVVVLEVEAGVPIVLINPEIKDTSGEQISEEACLSVPDRYGTTTRPMNVTVEYTDRDGKEGKIEASGFLAKAICHEIDHLDGILYIDSATDIQEC